MSLQLIENELNTNSQTGILYNSLNTAIRVRGTDATSQALSGLNSTSNQIQFYNGTTTTPSCIAAFDVPGLLIADGNSIVLGTTTNYMKLNHNGTSSEISYDTLNVSVSGTPIITYNSDASVSTNYPITTTNLTCGSLLSNTPIKINGNVNQTNGSITLGTNFNTLVTYIITNIINNNINVNNKPSV